jgi:arylsulfatase A-like enzyme
MASSRHVSRRTFLKAAAGAAGLAATAGIARKVYVDRTGPHYDLARAERLLSSIQPASNPGQLPNIVILLTDDLGYGDLGSYGSAAVNTPHLDAMAAEGAHMTDFYAAAPICTPSRAALLTGRYAVRSLMPFPVAASRDPMRFLLDALGYYPYGITAIPHDEVLLPEILQRRGYRTALIGKWHLGDKEGDLPNDRGFDYFYGSFYANDDSFFDIRENQQVVIPIPVDQNPLTQKLTEKALAFINDSRDAPFFLYLAYFAPHNPEHASDAFRGKSQGGLYGDAVEEVDWSVGQVLSTLRQAGLDEKTLVVFSSDNGPWYEGSPGFTRGRKLLFFEGGLRVPLIARWPGVIPEGLLTHEMGVNFDLFTTCLGIAGVPLPQDRIIDGKDLLPVLQGQLSAHDAFYYYDVRRLVGVRRGDYKYLREHAVDNGAFRAPFIVQGPFLFDLTTDPNESYSLIPTHPDVAQSLAAMLDAWDAQMAVNLRGWL